MIIRCNEPENNGSVYGMNESFTAENLPPCFHEPKVGNFVIYRDRINYSS